LKAGIIAAAFGFGFGIGVGAVAFVAPTFLEKCRSDIQLSKNAGRIADALEKHGH
jgi:hypothetical protein